MRHGCDHALAAQRAAPQPRQVGRRPRFVDENEPALVKPELLCPPRGSAFGDIRSVLLGGPERFF
jgi:hypothetical protein